MSAAKRQESLHWWEHPLLIVAWGAAWIVYAGATTRPGQFSLTAFVSWGVGCLVWLLVGGFMSNRFYNGSPKGIAEQGVSQTGNFPEGR